MADTDLDYTVWRADRVPGDPLQWAWEVVRVDDEGEEFTLDGGFEATQETAERRAKEYIRMH